MTQTLFTALAFYRRGQWRKGGILAGAGGRIEKILSPKEAAAWKGERRDFENGVLVPGCVNAHSHAFQILLRGQSDGAKNFSDWVDRQLYPLALRVTEKDLHASARMAFREMLQNGITTVGEFFYIHNAPKTFRRTGIAYDELMIDAARAEGIRIVLLRSMYDSTYREGQKRFFEPSDEARQNVQALMKRHADDPLVAVRPAPHSLHGASEEMIRAGAELARAWGAPYHIHLAEKRSDRDFAQKRFGTTPLRALKKMGALGDHAAIVHGVWLDRDEVKMLADAGARVVSNPRSNMALGDGIAPLAEMSRAGVRVALGCDGPCANNSLDIYSEMRAAEHLQRVRLERINVIPQEGVKGKLGADSLFRMGTAFGGEILGIPAGEIEKGQYADLVALDVNDASLLPNDFSATRAPRFDRDEDALDPLLANIIFSMSPRAAIKGVVVGGKAAFSRP